MSAQKPPPPRIRANAATIGTARPSDLAHFYAGLLDLTVTVDDAADPDGHPFCLFVEGGPVTGRR